MNPTVLPFWAARAWLKYVAPREEQWTPQPAWGPLLKRSLHRPSAQAALSSSPALLLLLFLIILFIYFSCMYVYVYMHACGLVCHSGACVKVRAQLVGSSLLRSSGLAASDFAC